MFNFSPKLLIISHYIGLSPSKNGGWESMNNFGSMLWFTGCSQYYVTWGSNQAYGNFSYINNNYGLQWYCDYNFDFPADYKALGQLNGSSHTYFWLCIG